MKIRPLNDWAVIVPAPAEVRTAGGLYLPDTAKEKPAEGIVEAIGPGALEEERWEDRKKEKSRKKERKFVPTSVKPGERVMYERFAGQTIELGGEERVLVRERSILGILPPAPARPQEELPPLLLPAATSSSAETALMERRSGPSTPVAGTGTAKPTKTAAATKTKKKAAGSRGQGTAKGKAAAKGKAKNAAATRPAAKPKKAAAKKSGKKR
jgi:chaperonin GroES